MKVLGLGEAEGADEEVVALADVDKTGGIVLVAVWLVPESKKVGYGPCRLG